MIYLFQVSICWVFFYAIYALFLKKETFFGINRLYLMSSLILGLIIPFLGMLIPANATSEEVIYAMAVFTEVQVTPESAMIQSNGSAFSWYGLLWIAYWFGVTVVLSRIFYGISKIYSIYKGSKTTDKGNYILVESDKEHLPFSFFHMIFISKSLPLKGEIEKILRHEELHVNHWHSADILCSELLQAFFWFNPIIHFYKKALRQSHEYTADAYVTQGYNKNSYGQLLLAQSHTGLEIALSNHFFHSQIKKRITMMYQERSKPKMKLKYLTAVPVLVALLFLFSSNTDKENVQEYSSNSTQEIKVGDVTNILVSSEDKLLFEGVDYTINKAEGTLTIINKDLLDPAAPITVGFSDPSDDCNQFDGRKFLVRGNFMELHNEILKTQDEIKEPATIVMDAVANSDGKITYLEVNQKKSTVTDRKILKSAMHLAYKSTLEPGTTTACGEIVYNFSNIVDEHKLNRTITILEEGKYWHKSMPINLDEVKTLVQKLGENKQTLIISPKDKAPSKNVIELLDVATSFGVNAILSSEDAERIANTFPDSNDDVFKVVEEMPRFPGCEDMEGTAKEKEECAKKKMLTFLYSNITYPSQAKKADIEGTNVIQFIVEKDGSISSGQILRNIGGGCGEEGLRVINQMPIWIPGKMKGNPVRVQYTIPIKFKLESEKDVDQPTTESNTSSLPKADEMYGVVEEMPRFPGCEDQDLSKKDRKECAQGKMLEFIYKNIKYPAQAREEGIGGMVIVKFTVTKEGDIINPKIIRQIGGGCDEEVIKVINQMPRWIPGKQAGKKVNVYYTLPVKFKIENDDLNEKLIEGANNMFGAKSLKFDTPTIIGQGTPKDKKIAKDVDNMPLFPNTLSEEESKNKLLQFVYKNLKYSTKAIDNGIEGMIIIRFLIDEKGQIVNYNLAKSLGWGLDEEVQKMMLQMKNKDDKWTPAQLDGEDVSFEYTLPLKFRLEDNQKEEAKDRKLEISQLNLSPNPSDGNFYLAFETKKSDPINITVYSSVGTILKEVTKNAKLKSTSSGYFLSQNIDVSDWPSQTIFIRIEQNGKFTYEKAVIH